MTLPLIEKRREAAKRALADLPETIRIGGHDVVIVIRDKFLTTGGLLGQYDEDAQVISLSEDMQTPGVVVETFIHEVTHGLYRQSRLEPDDSEERVVSSIAANFVHVVRDNPWYAKWIVKHL